MNRFITITSLRVGYLELIKNLCTENVSVKMATTIILLSDFGLEDAYVGVMKSVILGICHEVKIIDLCHAIPSQDVMTGCLTLEDSRTYFPKGSIIVAVVDPGVGTSRAALALKTESEIFIAPDNGLLSFLPESEIIEARRIENQAFMLDEQSRTFHGRDIFAPAAARLASGAAFCEIGAIASEIKRILKPEPLINEDGLAGQVVMFDKFGNAATNIRQANLPAKPFVIFFKGGVLPMTETYEEADADAPACLINASGRLEICVRNGNAKDFLKIRRFDPILIKTSVD